MEAKFDHHRKEIERIQQVLEGERSMHLTFKEAGNLWNNVSRAHGGADWLLLPKNDHDLVEFVVTTPSFSFENFLKEDPVILEQEED